MWVQLAIEYPCYARRIGNYFCRAYQLSDTIWRWEVWKIGLDRSLAVVRLGTQPAPKKAMDAAEGHVLTLEGRAPGKD